MDYSGNLYFNEINTLPGFNKKALFVKLWEENYSYLDLLNLILLNSIND